MKKKRFWLWNSPIILAIAIGGFYLFKIKDQSTPFSLELRYLQYNIQMESKYPLKREKARKYFFYEGWDDELNKPRALRRQLVIRFFSISNRDKRLYLKLNNPNFRSTHDNLEIAVFLNRSFLKQLYLERSGEFLLLLTANRLRGGENFLKFQIKRNPGGKNSFAYRPHRVWFVVQDIYFQNIRSSKTPFSGQQKRKVRLHQTPHSILQLAVNTSETRKLNYRVTLESPRKCTGELVIWQREGKKNPPRKILTHPLEHRRLFSSTLKLSDRGHRIILEFAFHCADDRSFLVWKKLTEFQNESRYKDQPEIKPFKKKPHIFLILIDAARSDLVNQKVDGKPVTPRINRFAAVSSNFLNFYANAPYTGPSVATMLSGYLPEVHTLRELSLQLPANVKTLPSYLKEAGYRTIAVVGNTVLLKHRLARGFDTAVLIRPVDETAGEEKTSFNDIEEAVRMIRNLDSRLPHFVYFHFLPPHEPYQPPSQWNQVIKESSLILHDGYFDERFIENRYRTYLNNARYADFLVGRIIEAIQKKGLFDDALVIVTSDHGEAFGEHGLLGHVSSSYEEMIHVPFLLKMPGQHNKLSVETPCSHVDLLPTLAALVRIPSKQDWQGRPIPFSEDSAEGSGRIVYSRAAGEGCNMAISCHHHKYQFFFGRDDLYDLRVDPAEQHNLRIENPFLVLYLRQKLFQQYAQNMQLRQKLNIKSTLSNTMDLRLMEELKTLGYIEFK